MNLEDLNEGDILIPNGRFRGVVTKDVHEKNIALVVTRIDAPHHFFVAIAVVSSDKARVGEKVVLHENDLTCFNVHATSVKEYMSHENKVRYLKLTIGDESSLGIIGEASPFDDDFGNALYVGDTVTATYDFCSFHKCVVAHDKLGYFVMGIHRFCDKDSGKISKFFIKKDSDWRERYVGERLPGGRIDSNRIVEVTYENPNE